MHGFLFDDKTKKYRTIDDPNAAKGPNAMTVVNGINDKGQLVGFYRGRERQYRRYAGARQRPP